MSHLDYCSANYLRVVGHKTGNDFFVAHPPTHTAIQARDSEEQVELVPCPGSILRAVARILIERCLSVFFSEKNRRTRRRRERDLATPVECPERRKLLQRVALLEEESFASLIATLPHFADNLSSNSGS